MKHVIKYFRGPAFTAAEWTARNPLLASGEIGYLLEGGLVTRAKVGPGLWEDLDWFGGDTIYSYVDEVTNIIGDAQGNLQGNSLEDIIHLMLNPYVVPAFSSVRNGPFAGFQTEHYTRDIGNPLSGSVYVKYDITGQENLTSDPYVGGSDSMFSNNGNYPIGLTQMTLTAPLNPNTIKEYIIYVIITYTQNGVNWQKQGQTYLKFIPRIIWIANNNATMTSPQFESIINKSYIAADDYKKDYYFGGNGYSWIAIPAMLNPSNLVFTDVINPTAPAGYSIEDMGPLTFNNGITSSYPYQMFRSTFKLIAPTILRVR